MPLADEDVADADGADGPRGGGPGGGGPLDDVNEDDDDVPLAIQDAPAQNVPRMGQRENRGVPPLGLIEIVSAHLRSTVEEHPPPKRWHFEDLRSRSGRLPSTRR